MYYGDIWESDGKTVLELLFFYDRWKTPNRAHITVYENKIDSISCYVYHSFRKMNLEQTEIIHKQEAKDMEKEILQAATMFQFLKNIPFSEIKEVDFRETKHLVFIDFTIPTSPFTFTFLLRKFNEDVVIKILSFECRSEQSFIHSFFLHSKHRIRLLPYLEKMLV